MTKLEQLLSTITNKQVYIQPHNYPDQDAIASAFALQDLLNINGISAIICYKGIIDKSNTISMIKELNIDITNIDDLHNMIESDEIIIVDSQKGNNNVEDFIGNEIACIDHHEGLPKENLKFCDIRSEVGACSSIIASYYLENKIDMNERVATALLYGIKMDTNGLERGVSELDIDMFYYLYKKADLIKVHKFEACSLQREDLDAYAKAIESLKIYDRVGFVDIGMNCSEAILGTISDFILSLEEIVFSVVYTRRAGGIKYSVRSEEPNLNAAKIISQVLKGYGSGGGHSAMAAGFIPNVSEENEQEIKDTIVQRVINSLAG